MRDLIDEWKDELTALKEDLVALGSTPNTLEYNLLSCEALRLSMRISDALELELKLEIEIEMSENS